MRVDSRSSDGPGPGAGVVPVDPGCVAAAAVGRALMLDRPILKHSQGLYVDDMRLTRKAFGVDSFVYVALPDLLPPSAVARCLAAQSTNFNCELPGIPKGLRAATARTDQTSNLRTTFSCPEIRQRRSTLCPWPWYTPVIE
jgi:hypothetical protein